MKNMEPVPRVRVRDVNARPVNPRGHYVLYWMIAHRRLRDNFSLQRAVEHALQLGRPLVILEALRCDYPWASERLHGFVIQGMGDNRRRSAKSNVLYYPYVEPAPTAGAGLLTALANDACVVVTDDYPCFFLPRMVAATGKKLAVLLEAVDSNGLLPLTVADKVYATAHAFRQMLELQLPLHWQHLPERDPLVNLALPTLQQLPEEIITRWPMASEELLALNPAALRALPIDHTVTTVEQRGGGITAERRLRDFLDRGLEAYNENRNQPDDDATSNLAPYLHFGHVSIHTIFREITRREEWSPRPREVGRRGSKTGWWGLSNHAEAFLDQCVTWRELGFNFSRLRADYDQYLSLPEWAQTTLEEHANDPRAYCYSLEDFSAAATHDELWNAAQIQLLREGRIHNYLRMLWGKKILEWSASPRQALATMIELNNRLALDGRDPNSYSGIFWCLGRYDRPWGPERPIFGKIRYMSSDNTRRKLQVEEYLQRYQP